MALTKPSSVERPFVKDSSYPFGLGSSRNFRLRNVRNIVTVQLTAEAQRREAEVENMRSWEAEKISTSQSLSLCVLCASAVSYYQKSFFVYQRRIKPRATNPTRSGFAGSILQTSSCALSRTIHH